MNRNGPRMGEGDKRKAQQQGDQASGPKGNTRPGGKEKLEEYQRALLAEKVKLHEANLPHCERLIDEEIERSYLLKAPPKSNKYADLYNDRLIKVDVKVLIPTRDHPNFNFVGKLLGPKGNTMKKLKDETQCKISIYGKGSMRDKEKEEEMRSSLDPTYAHLNDELHVGISALAPPAEAYARMSYALAEVKKYLVPDANEPMRGPGPMGPGDMFGGPPRGPRGPLMGRGPPGPPRLPPDEFRGPPGPPRQKVLSILDRARASMEESYGFNQSFDGPPMRQQQEPPPRQQQFDEDDYSYYEEPQQAPRNYFRDSQGADTDSYQRNDYGFSATST